MADPRQAREEDMKRKQVNGNRIVRHASKNGGACALLGVEVDQTPHKIIYICDVADGRRSYIAKRHVHLAPCLNCPDHPKSRFPATD